MPWLPEEDIPIFYSSLDLSAYLSGYEGFGLPPMEALQCDTVPLLLHGSSLSELYSTCALFADSPEPTAIASIINSFLKHPETKTNLLNQWQAHQHRFSWGKAAKQYLHLLKLLKDKQRLE